MSNIKKFEEVLHLITNEEFDRAEELLHDVIVETGRNVWSDLVNEDEDQDEYMGGDQLEDFISDVEHDESDIENDEMNDGEVEASDEQEENEEMEDEVDELKAQLADLTAKFDQLLKDEMKEPYHDPADYGMEDEVEDAEVEDAEEDQVNEATKFSDEVSTSMDKEGEYVGTGDKSKKAKVNTDSPYSQAARKEKDAKGHGPVDFTKGGEEKGMKADLPKDHADYDNMYDGNDEVKNSQMDDAEYVGTGKNSKKGAVGKESPLSKKPE